MKRKVEINGKTEFMGLNEFVSLITNKVNDINGNSISSDNNSLATAMNAERKSSKVVKRISKLRIDLPWSKQNRTGAISIEKIFEYTSVDYELEKLATVLFYSLDAGLYKYKLDYLFISESVSPDLEIGETRIKNHT